MKLMKLFEEVYPTLTTKKRIDSDDRKEFDVLLNSNIVGRITAEYKQMAKPGSRSTDFQKWKFKWKYIGEWYLDKLSELYPEVGTQSSRQWGSISAFSLKDVLQDMIFDFKRNVIG